MHINYFKLKLERNKLKNDHWFNNEMFSNNKYGTKLLIKPLQQTRIASAERNNFWNMHQEWLVSNNRWKLICAEWIFYDNFKSNLVLNAQRNSCNVKSVFFLNGWNPWEIINLILNYFHSCLMKNDSTHFVFHSELKDSISPMIWTYFACYMA